MAETEPADYPYYEAAAYHIFYKEYVTQDELNSMPKYPIEEPAEVGKMYRWDDTRAVVRNPDFTYRFFILKEAYEAETSRLHEEWKRRRGNS